MNRWLSPWLRLAVTLALLGVLAWKLDTGQLLERLMALSPAWVAAAVLLGIPQVAISAWRWRMTAHRIGIALRWPVAIREYYLATFLNQVLPGGGLGDAARAWRHGNTRTHSGGGHPPASGPAVRAVIIERASGQVALLLVAVVAVCLSPDLRHGIARAWQAQATTLTWLLLAALLLVGIVIGVSRRWRWTALATFGQDIRRALLTASVWPAQLLSSLLVTATYVAVFLCAAQALGLQRPIPQLLPLIPPLLMAMAIPLTVAGWGLREGAAAVIWPLAGLPAQEGVALSVAYGLLVLAASLPGLGVLLWDRRASRAASVRRKMAAEGHPG
ncbi:MAG: flippase-like domain-containing protein [Salinicola sp.]|uniref:lysylphosphatidylglycerol synthase transmembrane domain-containing protein n=1 Tax=Salinicola sp. TaxID=1978524 RepID=UPI001D33D164|nr:lysylphosphatidylglycerol synthase transmembrane domain-containing protein [Salinicola sp.]NRB56889.1 flippase-like domain-containing protein [Salinicola sp.]